MAASGCTQILDQAPQGQVSGSGEVSVGQFSARDSSLRPGQQTTLTAVVESGTPVEVTNLTIYGLGSLSYAGEPDVSDWRSHCTGSTRPAGRSPGVLECSWTVEAPSEEDLGAVPSRSFSPKMLLRYERNFSNSDEPIKIHFRERDRIDDVQEFTRTFSNGELDLRARMENPVPTGRTSSAEFTLRASEGVVSDRFRVAIEPGSIFSCESSSTASSFSSLGQESDIGAGASDSAEKFEVSTGFNSETQFICEFSEDRDLTRNVVISTSYKYQKSPSTSIEVTKQ